MKLRTIFSLQLLLYFALILKDCASENFSEENNEQYPLQLNYFIKPNDHKSRNATKVGSPIIYAEAWKLGQPHNLECVRFMREIPSSSEPQYYCKWKLGGYVRRYFWEKAEKICIELKEENGQNFWRCRSPDSQFALLKRRTLLPDWCRDLIPVKKYENASVYTKEQFRKHCEALIV